MANSFRGRGSDAFVDELGNNSGSDVDYDPPEPTSPVDPALIEENFKVAIRVRPAVPRELEGPRGFLNVVRIPTDHTSITLCDLDTEDARGSVYSTQTYSFDHVYDQSARQRDVYDNSADPAVSSVLQGYNATLIAYGQTGTGKTYTMEGFTQGEHRGIIPIATEEIFAAIQKSRPGVSYQVRASYVQIYNEIISDLLKAPSNKQLVIRQSKQRVYVDGLSEWVVRSPREIYGLMERGCSVRATGTTKMSELSSRSHAIFQIVVEILEGDREAPRSFKVGKLNIVDLAGSEKVRATGVTGQRLEETKKINWSLHQLGNVISALTDPNRRDPHIPYRNSKLTHLLTDSLGGNCKTTLIACISPAFESYQESLSTLKFASRAKQIRNEAVVNEDVDQRTLIAKYEKELKRLRGLLADRGDGPMAGSQSLGPSANRQQAVEDRDHALVQLEARDRAYDQEKRDKQRLEERVFELEHLLVNNGVAGREDGGDGGKEDMAQVERYKQLLLKQRDIMLNLTQRLNERDETIIKLQEEIDAYDEHVQELEDRLEIQAPTSLSRADAERHLSQRKVLVRGDVRYQAEGNTDRLLTPEEKVVELLMLKGRDNGGASSSPSSPQHGSAPDGATRKALEQALYGRVEEIAHRIVRDRCAAITAQLSGVKLQLAEAEEKARAASMAGDVAQMPQLQAQSDRIKQYVQSEAEHVRAPLRRRIEELEQLLAAERRDKEQVISELDRVAFDVRRFRQSVDAGKARESQALWDQVVIIEQQIGREVFNELAKQAAADTAAHAAAAGNAGAPRRVDPMAPAGNNNPSSLRIMQLESTIDTLKRQMEASKGEMQAAIDDRSATIRALEAESAKRDRDVASVRRALHTHEKDRAALKKIMEQRVKVKVDAIAAVMSGDRDTRKITNEVTTLQNLVNAAINAMNADQQQ